VHDERTLITSTINSMFSAVIRDGSPVSHAVQVLVAHGMRTHPSGSTIRMSTRSALRHRALRESRSSSSSAKISTSSLFAFERGMKKRISCGLIGGGHSWEGRDASCQELSRKLSQAKTLQHCLWRTTAVIEYIAIAQELFMLLCLLTCPLLTVRDSRGTCMNSMQTEIMQFATFRTLPFQKSSSLSFENCPISTK
jgi:hypothetical protein